ncbi:glycosyltransferase family 1 protein [Leucobacter sp. CSA1]|uniref:Glycosyltransferase family 1 protein n=1 Tax=Leucobacter chromiisoli TaxID=2796471 RepID=A0A934Q4X5_9MICO|nr:glycosyltransferase family 1 protein [Leucobacter chromiisoli]MBK0417683.1 glycosyltransferase family 1 protein [Leucobacter chromiisoli]
MNLFKDRYRVVTCSYGPAPEGIAEHIQVPDSESISYMNGRLITLKMYRKVYWGTPAIAWAKEKLKGRAFDVILANDFEAVPLAVALGPSLGVHADLHEYSPSQFEHNPDWARRIRPYREWVCKKYVSRADSWTTVCQGLSDKYFDMFGFRSEVVTNAAPYAALAPTPVHDPIKIVHHGGASAFRGIDRMVEAVMASSRDLRFDLYLQDVGGSVIEALRELSKDDPRITVHDAVPYAELIPLLNQYDVGIYSLPPVSFNHLHALPNKLFDYAQARVGIIVGPSPEMARVVEQNLLGEVLPDFDGSSLTHAIDALDPERIAEWKKNADAAARALSAEAQNAGWERPIDALFAR